MNPTDQLIADAKRYQSIHEFSQHAAAEKGIELLDHFIARFIARVRELEAWKAEEQVALVKMSVALLNAGFKGDGVVDGVQWIATRVRELEAERASLAWSDAKPTVPGLFLHRLRGESRPERWELVVTVRHELHGIVRNLSHDCGGYGWSWPLPDGQFAGPIPTPTEAAQ